MNKREMKKFEKLLLIERDRYAKGIRTIEEGAKEGTLTDSSNDLISFAEAGTDNNDRETALRLASEESGMLQEVLDALDRIKEGTYGICVDCEKPIPTKRLEVFPAALRCVECKSRMEKEGDF